MRLLDRYLLRELLVPLGYCLGGFLVFWMAFDLFGNLGVFQNNKMHGPDVAEYYLLKIPEFLVVVLPIALLLALLYTLTNHARHHEITAIRAAGLSLWRLCLPYLAVGLLSSIALLLVNELLVPDSDNAADQVLNRRVNRPAGAPEANHIANLGFVNASAGRSWKIKLYNLDTSEMAGVQVIWKQPDGSSRWLTADRAVWTNSVWVFYNVIEFEEAAGSNSLPLPLLRTNMLARPDFFETPDQIKSEITLSESMTLLDSKKADIPIVEIRNYLRLHPDPSRTDKYWLYTKMQGRLAAPWTCLVVVLIAIPFGSASGRRNVFVGIAGSIAVCFWAFVLRQIALTLG